MHWSPYGQLEALWVAIEAQCLCTGGPIGYASEAIRVYSTYECLAQEAL